MFKAKKNNSSEDFDTIIGKNIIIEGNFSGQGNILIEGGVNGSIHTDSLIVISNSAKITGDITSEEAIISGTINGNIKAHKKIILESNSNTKGDIETENLEIKNGANFNGASKMINNNNEDSTENKS